MPTAEEVDEQVSQLQASAAAIFGECRRQIKDNIDPTPVAGTESAQDCAARFAHEIASTLELCKRCGDSSRQAGLQKEVDELTRELQEKVSNVTLGCEFD